MSDPRICSRHLWSGTLTGVWECKKCGRLRDEAKSRRGRTVRSYGNRAELSAARKYGGQKEGHHGGPVDIRGKDFVTQMRTKRRPAPPEWVKAIGAMSSEGRISRLLVRYVQPGMPPDDWFIFRAGDFLDWFGRDEEAEA